MDEFSLREVCSSLIQELNKKIGDKNIVNLQIESEIPDWYCGQALAITKPLKTVSDFIAQHLVNGMVSLEIKEWNKKGNEIYLCITIAGNGIAEHGVSPKYKSEEKLIQDFQSLGLDSPYEISFSAKNRKLISTIGLTLPLSEKDNSFAIDGLFHDKRALIVEDNEVNAIVFSSFMEDWGINAELAYNGQDGVEMAWSNEYHAIIMDIYMPGLNGIEATKKIREFNVHVPVIALSASTLQTDVKNAFDAGVNEYLSKPVSSEKLFSTLSKLLLVPPPLSVNAQLTKASN